jgi:putative hydrolase of the HAD superfamily
VTAAPAAFFFDAGNTLLTPHPSVSAVVRQILAEAGHIHDLDAIDALMPLVDEFYEDRYRADDTFWTDEEQTSQVWIGMYSLLCRKLGIHEQAETIALRVYDEFGRPDRWRAFDDVVPCLTRLRAAGAKTAVISNWDRRLEAILAGLNLGDLLDATVSSAAVGLHKPDPRIFEEACRRLGVEPEDCVHVGDHYYADYLGASAVGMKAVLIQRVADACTAPKATTIATLDDLEAALAR